MFSENRFPLVNVKFNPAVFSQHAKRMKEIVSLASQAPGLAQELNS